MYFPVAKNGEYTFQFCTNRPIGWHQTDGTAKGTVHIMLYIQTQDMVGTSNYKRIIDLGNSSLVLKNDKYYSTFTVPADYDYVRALLRIDGHADGTEYDLRCWNFQAEEGSKDTTWKPPVESMATSEQAQQAQNDATEAQNAATNAQKKADTAVIAASNAQAAADKAQQDVAALTKRVTSAETAITQNTEQIRLSATKTEEIGTKLDNLQVGGRNLLKDTASDLYNQKITKNTTKSHSRPINLIDGFDFKYLINKQLAFSFKIKNTGTSQIISSNQGSYLNTRFGGYITAGWRSSSPRCCAGTCLS